MQITGKVYLHCVYYFYLNSVVKNSDFNDFSTPHVRILSKLDT